MNYKRELLNDHVYYYLWIDSLMSEGVSYYKLKSLLISFLCSQLIVNCIFLTIKTKFAWFLKNILYKRISILWLELWNQTYFMIFYIKFFFKEFKNIKNSNLNHSLGTLFSLYYLLSKSFISLIYLWFYGLNLTEICLWIEWIWT